MPASVQFDIIGNDRASDAFDSASRSADRAADRFSSAADESVSRIDRVAEAADGSASATSQLAGGIGDIAGALEATGLISEGTAQALAVTEASIMGLTGAADLANFATEKLRLAQVGQKVATVASTVATKAATVATWAFSAAQRAMPIILIVTLIGALVAAIIWFFTQTEVGRAIVSKAWAGIQRAMAAVTNWWQKTAWPVIRATWQSVIGSFNNARAQIGRIMGVVWDVIRRVWAWSPLGLVINNWSAIMGWLSRAPGRIAGFFTSLPGRIGGALSGLFDPLWQGFRGAVNNIVAGWNRLSFTIGGGSIAGISIPSVTLSTPNIPYLARGGDILRGGAAVVGDAGPELLQLPTGARVTPLTGQGPAEPQEIRLVIDGAAGGDVGRFLAEILGKYVRVQGGNVQTAIVGAR
ncbi:hypothetical protein [Promicromonospora sp. NPDC050880]|uniref:hypothetical protein n=1 Tax=Promicromonospora sp. NPDC050880 TaxID=3364406 RepID=UPI0037B616EB